MADPCVVCGKPIPRDHMNVHVNRCLDGEEDPDLMPTTNLNVPSNDNNNNNNLKTNVASETCMPATTTNNNNNQIDIWGTTVHGQNNAPYQSGAEQQPSYNSNNYSRQSSFTSIATEPCPVCNQKVKPHELEAHVTEHFKDEEIVNNINRGDDAENVDQDIRDSYSTENRPSALVYPTIQVPPLDNFGEPYYNTNRRIPIQSSADAPPAPPSTTSAGYDDGFGNAPYPTRVNIWSDNNNNDQYSDSNNRANQRSALVREDDFFYDGPPMIPPSISRDDVKASSRIYIDCPACPTRVLAVQLCDHLDGHFVDVNSIPKKLTDPSRPTLDSTNTASDISTLPPTNPFYTDLHLESMLLPEQSSQQQPSKYEALEQHVAQSHSHEQQQSQHQELHLVNVPQSQQQEPHLVNVPQSQQQEHLEFLQPRQDQQSSKSSDEHLKQSRSIPIDFDDSSTVVEIGNMNMDVSDTQESSELPATTAEATTTSATSPDLDNIQNNEEVDATAKQLNALPLL